MYIGGRHWNFVSTGVGVQRARNEVSVRTTGSAQIGEGGYKAQMRSYVHGRSAYSDITSRGNSGCSPVVVFFRLTWLSATMSGGCDGDSSFVTDIEISRVGMSG